MAYKDINVNWTELIKFGKEGITIADYQEIRTAISNRFKEIYGQDIDLATTSADGVYVETLCLMINNILQSFKQFYSQLDVRTASGNYLDALCALSNVYRKPETNSTCSILLTLDATATQNYVTKSISVADKNGNIWSYESNEDITFEPGKAKEIIVTCETPGPIRASAGWIDRLVSNEVTMTVSQTVEANEGSYSESDSELRSRRNDSLGATGNTVLESLAGALLAITGIDDVKIYCNDSKATLPALDDTNIALHDVYVILRKKPNIDIADSTICNTIYEKLTPGIRTTESAVTSDAKSYNYVSSILGQTQLGVVQKVNWKQATPVKPVVKIIISPNQNFARSGNSTANLIAQNVINQLNNAQLSSTIKINDLWSTIMYSDPLFRGISTFSISSISIDGKDADYTLKDTYFDYSSSNIKVEETSFQTITITIGE